MNRNGSRSGRGIDAAVAAAFLLSALCVGAAAPALAQTIAVGSASGLPGAAVDVAVTLNPASASVSTLQFDLGFGTALTYVSTTAGASATAAGKTVTANPVAGGLRVLIFALNNTAMAQGGMAVVRFNISASAPAGNQAVSITNVVASDPVGNPVALSASGGTVTVNAPADTTAPVISSVAAGSITQTGAIITWTTNEASDTQVDYGTTASYGSVSSLNTSRVTSHSQSVSGLSAGTLYHYRVKSRDAAGNLATSGDFTFTTTQTADTTAPVISAVTAGSLTQTAAVITWTTNEASDTQVDYGTTASYGSTSSLNTSMVTSHSQSLSGLSAGTLYHYRVKSRDAAGNLATSGDFTFTTAQTADTTAPVISNVTVVATTANSATVAWSTDEDADSQTDYGLSLAYGSASALDSTRVRTHTQTLSGLTANTTYNFRVRSRDAAGNLAVSGNYTLKTGQQQGDTTPPIVSGVGVNSTTGTSTIITWVTNEEADAQVEYGQSTGYGSLSSTDTAKSTGHSVTLSGLSPKTTYHFRVRSRDAAGNLGVSGNYTFTTLDQQGTPEKPHKLFYPRVKSGKLSPAAADESDEYTGVAIANLDNKEATLTFTAYDGAGKPLTGAGINNPVSRTLKPGEQLPIIDTQLFGDGIAAANGSGWIKVESTVTKIAGFFLMFNSALDVLDGANVSATPLTTFVLPEVEDQGYTKLNLGNPENAAATVRIDLMRQDGSPRGSATRTVPAEGSLTLELRNDLFPENPPQASDYVRVSSDIGLLPFQLLGKTSQYIEGLNGQSAASGDMVLYSPQFAIGGPWRSTLSIVNLEATPGSVTLRYIADDATQIGTARVLAIAGYGKIYIDDPAFFQAPGQGQILSGYVEIRSSGVRLTGAVVFGDPGRSRFSSALPLVSKLQDAVLFSQVASNDLYFTGLAILNPSSLNAVATIDLFGSDGRLEASASEIIPGRQRSAKVLTQIFPALVGQNRSSGYIRVTVDRPVASFALFGTNDLSVLSAVPPQEIPK